MGKRIKRIISVLTAFVMVFALTFVPTKSIKAATGDPIFSINGVVTTSPDGTAANDLAKLNAAITAGATSTIVLLSDFTGCVAISKSCSIDINGHNLTATGSNGVFKISGNMTLSVYDSGAGTVTCTDNNAVKLNGAKAAINIYGGKFIGSQGNGCVVGAGSTNGDVTVNYFGGTIINKAGTPIGGINLVKYANYYCESTTTTNGTEQTLQSKSNVGKDLGGVLTAIGTTSIGSYYSTLGAQYKDASVGYDTTNAIRFGGKITKNLLSTSLTQGYTPEYGMLIASATRMSAAGVTELTASNIASCGVLVKTTKIFGETTSDLTFAISVINIPTDKVDIKITARPFIKVGSSYTYLDPIVKSYTDIKTATSFVK